MYDMFGMSESGSVNHHGSTIPRGLIDKILRRGARRVSHAPSHTWFGSISFMATGDKSPHTHTRTHTDSNR